MDHWKRWLLLLGAGIVVFGALLLFFSLFFADFLVDLFWFRALQYELYFWQRFLYRYVILVSVTLLFFSIFFLNFWVASRYLGTTAPPDETGPSAMKAYKDVFKMFRTGSMRVYTPLSFLLSIPLALPLFRQWEAFLLYIFGPTTGIHDPVYSKDISYYLFSYPIYILLQQRLLITFSLLFIGLVILYWLEKKLLSQQEQQLPQGAKWHLSVLLVLVFSIQIWGFLLQRYSLLYSTEHEPLFFGPGYVEMNVILPLIWISIISLAGAGIAFILFVHRRKGFKTSVGFALLFGISLFFRYSGTMPLTIQKYIVKPNEISREKPYIVNNINSTLNAFHLNNVEIRDFRPERGPQHITTSKVKDILRNIPVWDGELLNEVYAQLQTLRTYYDFTMVDVSRYTVNGNYQQVFLAARELNTEELPPGARNWINDHLAYTHGYGIVMTPASQGGETTMVWFVREIPLESRLDFSIEQPGIYFGQLKNYKYAIAPNDVGEFHYPKGEENVRTDYEGRDGVPVASLLKKLLFAYYFKDKNIFFTTKTNDRSKILFRRNITERINTITPFLLLDRDPYIAATSKGLFWIQDAYLTSDWYPYAAVHTGDEGQINYIRNSVKIIVDAYNGTVDYYIFDPYDPMVRAYDRIYPGLFKRIDTLSPELMAQLCYPQDLFNIQMGIYAKYHQTDPEVFYKQEDIWEFAALFHDKEREAIRSYYLTLDLIERGRFDFLLLSPMSPKGRNNLRALALVDSDQPHYGRMIIYNFPKGELVYGPSQIYALINQDTRVAEQFTLWDQIGSQVERGKMIILPIGNVITYIQPVYLKASTPLQIPELKRLIMTQGEVVVMESSLEQAYVTMEERLLLELERIERRFAPSPALEPGVLSPTIPPTMQAPVEPEQQQGPEEAS
jgi:uncharacterized protein